MNQWNSVWLFVISRADPDQNTVLAWGLWA
jgi:hypothetical protein